MHVLGVAAKPARHRTALVGIVSDLATTTIGMTGGDEAGMPLIGIYLWVTIGNGFRFGARYLLVSYGRSLVGLAHCSICTFWQTHRAVVGLHGGISANSASMLLLYRASTRKRMLPNSSQTQELSSPTLVAGCARLLPACSRCTTCEDAQDGPDDQDCRDAWQRG